VAVESAEQLGGDTAMVEPKTGEQDPGAFIGQEPEREAELIPGGVRPGDERVAAHDAAPGAPGEPDAESQKSELDRHREAGQQVTKDAQRSTVNRPT
jgi:hypothetical protein